MIFQKIFYFLLHSSFQPIYLHISMQRKQNLIFPNFFSKCQHITYPHKTADLLIFILNKSLTENFNFLCREYYCFYDWVFFFKIFFKPNCQSFVYFTSINTWYRLVSILLFRNRFLALAVNNFTSTLADAYDFSNFNMICCLTD